MNLLTSLDQALASRPLTRRPARKALLSLLTPEQRRAYWDLRALRGARAARDAMGLPSTRKIERAP